MFAAKNVAEKGALFQLGVKTRISGRRWLLLRRSYDDTAIGYVSFFAALKIDGTWQFFVAVEGATGDTGNLLIVDNGLAILKNGDHSPNHRYVEVLPFSRLPGQFVGGTKKAV